MEEEEAGGTQAWRRAATAARSWCVLFFGGSFFLHLRFRVSLIATAHPPLSQATLPPAAPPHGGGVATSTTATPIQNSYTFHAVLGPTATQMRERMLGSGRERERVFNAKPTTLFPPPLQADVYDTARVARLVDATVAGYSATVFAYGQTGSGKTHTMLGPDRAADADAGLVERATHALFSQVAAASTADGCTYSVRAAAAEIYNEAVFDLLAPPTPPSASSPLARTPLAVKYDPGRGFHAPALTHVPARDAKDAARAFAAGAAARRVARHALNAESSRSHALFMLFVEVVPPPVGVATGGGGGGGTATPPTDAATTTPHPVRRLGRITFVDLAGSEKATASRSAGGTLREAGAINRSLFALRHVVAALAAPPPPPGAPPRHVPYRDSKLTKLLMDSLNGGLALLVACVSPARSAADESAATLVFAARAASLRTTPSLQVDPSDATLAALKREVLLLRAENAYLRGAAAGLPARGGSGATASGATTPGGTLRPRADADDDDGALGDEGPSSGAPSARATRDLSAAAARPASPLPSPPRAPGARLGRLARPGGGDGG